MRLIARASRQVKSWPLQHRERDFEILYVSWQNQSEQLVFDIGLSQVSVWFKIRTFGQKDCFSLKNQDYQIKIMLSFNNTDLQNCSLVHRRIDPGTGGGFKAILRVSKIKTKAG